MKPRSQAASITPAASDPDELPPVGQVRGALVVCPKAPDRIGGVYAADGAFLPSSGVKRGAGYGIDRVFGGELTPCPAPEASLAGEYVYIGANFSHFGHVLLEGLARFWYLCSERVDARVPLLVLPFPSSDLSLLKQFMTLLGQGERKIHVVDRPTRVETLYLPEVGFKVRGHGYARHLELLRRSAVARLGGPQVERAGAIYLSRAGLAGLRRKIIGEDLLEAYLASAGVEIFRPETVSLEEQARTLRRYDTVIGYVGSALHTLILCDPGLRVLYLSATEPHDTFPEIDRLKSFSGHYLVRRTEDCFPGFRPKRPQNSPVLLPILETVEFLRRHGIAGTMPAFERPELLARFAIAWMDWASTAGLDPRFAVTEHEDALRRSENAKAVLKAIARLS